MDVEKTIQAINKDRDRLEASFVFCLWKNPTLYDDYKDLDAKTVLATQDARFYYLLGKALRDTGLNTFNNLSIDNYLSTRPEIKKIYDNYGGWKEVDQILNLTDENNVESYYDQISKDNYLINVCEKYDKAFENVQKLKSLSSEDTYLLFDNINTSASLANNREIESNNLMITDADIDNWDKGNAVGVNYAKAFPLLNYTTLGLPKGDITLVTGHSGAGKTSFVFRLLLGIIQDGGMAAIISNEMQLDAYKHLLLIHVLTEELKDKEYYQITRKKLKQGHWSDEDKAKIKKAQAIVNEKYGEKLFFVKLFDNNSSIVLREMKRLNRRYGVKVFCWDTYKADDSMTNKMWEELLMGSRKVFNLVAKENFSLICTFQLALYTTNQRYLDAGCLSNSKQIKEVVSEHIMLRKLWQDEYTGEKYDCEPYKYNDKIKTLIQLDKDKTYVVAFIDKTRNDENARCILYQWDSTWNKWTELGFCTIKNDHKGI